MRDGDIFTLRGRVRLELRGPDGQLKEVVETDNLVTTVGKEAIAEQLLAAPGKEKPTNIAVGKSGTAAAEGQTALVEELARKAISSKTRSGKGVIMKTEFAAGEGTGEIKECGIFNAGAAGEMYTRATFGLITKEAADTLAVTWTLTIS